MVKSWVYLGLNILYWERKSQKEAFLKLWLGIWAGQEVTLQPWHTGTSRHPWEGRHQDQARSISPGSFSFLRRFCHSSSRWNNNFCSPHFRTNKVTMHICLSILNLKKKIWLYLLRIYWIQYPDQVGSVKCTTQTINDLWPSQMGTFSEKGVVFYVVLSLKMICFDISKKFNCIY